MSTAINGQRCPECGGGLFGPVQDSAGAMYWCEKCKSHWEDVVVNRNEFEKSTAQVFARMKKEIADLKSRVLQRVIIRVRAPYYCAKCNESITRHAAQTEDGCWYHLGCLTRADSPHYQAASVRVVGVNWSCGCGHHNGPNMAVCAACGRRPGVKV